MKCAGLNAHCGTHELIPNHSPYIPVLSSTGRPNLSLPRASPPLARPIGNNKTGKGGSRGAKTTGPALSHSPKARVAYKVVVFAFSAVVETGRPRDVGSVSPIRRMSPAVASTWSRCNRYDWNRSRTRSTGMDTLTIGDSRPIIRDNDA